jgi:hypothetical protein
MAIAPPPFMPLFLALVLATAPPPTPPRAPPSLGITLTASLGLALMGAGVGYQVSAPTSPHPEANTVGGVALITMGLCVFLIAALLTELHFPTNRTLVLGAQWP